MRVVIIGPGRIGCGYLAPLFKSADWDVVLTARSEDTAERIRAKGHFNPRVTPSQDRNHWTSTEREPPRTTAICGLRAVCIGTKEFHTAVATADLVCTAVGVGNVHSLAIPLASALAGRPASKPLDIWLVENDDCAATLKSEVKAVAARSGWQLPPVGFAGAIANVAVGRGTWRQGGTPEFVGDAARSLLVDKDGLIRDLPKLPGVETTTQYSERLREKLYVFNTGHAVCAYLGWLRGHATVDEAVRDAFLRPMVVGCLLESRRALLTAYPVLGTDVHGPVGEALQRFANRELADPIPRVARDPIRKLGRHDRILGPAHLVRRCTGRVPAYFPLAIAGALLYRAERDPQARELDLKLSRDGVLSVLQEVCGLELTDPLINAVAARYRNFIFTPEGTIFPPAHLPDITASHVGELAKMME
jgi:mannitol-1-phosphate 5-dehydrogenase